MLAPCWHTLSAVGRRMKAKLRACGEGGIDTTCKRTSLGVSQGSEGLVNRGGGGRKEGIVNRLVEAVRCQPHASQPVRGVRDRLQSLVRPWLVRTKGQLWDVGRQWRLHAGPARKCKLSSPKALSRALMVRSESAHETKSAAGACAAALRRPRLPQRRHLQHLSHAAVLLARRWVAVHVSKCSGRGAAAKTGCVTLLWVSFAFRLASCWAPRGWPSPGDRSPVGPVPSPTSTHVSSHGSWGGSHAGAHSASNRKDA